MNLDDPLFAFAAALAAGMTAQVIARHLRMPGIVVLLLAGVALGPDVANVIRPATLGDGLHLIVGAAVAVILFEGGMRLEIERLRHEASTIQRLVTIGAATTAIGAALAGRYVMGWDWRVAVPFGALVIVTGPTVITPLLRRIRITRNLHTILEAEGVLIDPIGAIVAVVAIEVVLAQELGRAARGLLGIPTRLLFGAALGAVGGTLIARLLAAERVIPEGLESVFTLALLLALFATSEALLSESGIMAAPIAGMVVGNTPSRPSHELREFKEQLTILLVGLLFVLLAADVRLAEVTGLGWRGVLVLVVLTVLVRPLDVAVSTAGSALTLRERAFLAWLAPRGIVAAAVASLFADRMTQEGIPEGVELRAMVFLVIATTVLVQGLGGGAVANLLGVRRPSNSGYLIAGANALARVLAEVLVKAGENVVLVDTDVTEIGKAQRRGISVIHGNALDEEVLALADVEGRRGVIGLIPNEGVSLLVADKARREFRVPNAHVVIRPGRSGVLRDRMQRIGARALFATEVDTAYWTRELEEGRGLVHTYRYAGAEERPSTYHEERLGRSTRAILPLVLQRRGRATPIDDQPRFRLGDLVPVLRSDPTTPVADGFEPVAEVAPDLTG